MRKETVQLLCTIDSTVDLDASNMLAAPIASRIITDLDEFFTTVQ